MAYIYVYIQLPDNLKLKFKNCNTSSKFQKSQSHEKLLLRAVPDGPWKPAGVDIFYFRIKPFLLLVDCFSKFIERKE